MAPLIFDKTSSDGGVSSQRTSVAKDGRGIRISICVRILLPPLYSTLVAVTLLRYSIRCPMRFEKRHGRGPRCGINTAINHAAGVLVGEG